MQETKKVAEESKKKRRVVKKTETVREKAAKAAEDKGKQRRVRRTASQAGKPLRATSNAVKKGAQPFGFLLKPFQTKPAYAIGRFLSKVLFISYIKNSWRELRQVSWPDRKNTTKLTLAVFAFAISFALVIAIADFGLDKVFKAILLD